MKKSLEKKVEGVLKKSRKSIGQIEIAQKVGVKNPFLIDRVLQKFEKQGLVISQ